MSKCIRWDLTQRTHELKQVQLRYGGVNVHNNCRRVVAEVAMTIFDKQMDGECLPREDWSPTWTGWTATGSGEERKRAKNLAPTERVGWGKWGFQSEGETPFMM